MSIATLIDRGLVVRAQMKLLKTELDGIEEKLEALGLKGEQEDLIDAEREGKRFLARGSELVIPIIFTADKLMASFKAESATHAKISAAAANRFQIFYQPSTSYEIQFASGNKFRTEAKDILGEKAGPFITACLARDKFGTPKSDVKIEWEKGTAV